MTGSPLGPFVGPSHVRRAVLANLATWAPFYVGEAIRQTGLELPGFTDFVNEPYNNAPTTIVEAPRYVVACPGTLDRPSRRGDGTYIATWDVQIALWMWGGDYQETEDNLGYYAIAIRELMLQQPSLGGFAKSIEWRGERYAQVDATAFRTWGQAVVLFGVQVDGVVSAYAGPSTPPLDPTAPPVPAPPVQSTSVTVTPK
ncbi:MAG: hypothetical protein JWO98_4525 [Frankiales bacterium]|nr:hypothetical protein [Frankiales bacterium]